MRTTLLLLALLLGSAVADPAPLRVVTTTTDLASIARAVGGGDVSVDSFCRGPEDPHFLDARPSFLRLVRDADLVVCVGLELEVGYLPLLLRDAGNPRVRPGAPGFLDASARVRKLQVREPGTVSRAEGDVHPLGNPHYLVDPANAILVAEDLAAALGSARPASAQAFRERAAAFRAAVEKLLLADDGILAPFARLRGAEIVSYHDDMRYLAARLGLGIAGTLEPKPGVPPTARHVAELTALARARGVRAVLYTAFQPRAPVDAFCRETGAKAVLVAHQPGATEEATDLLAMYRANAKAILAALGDGGGR